MLRHKDAIVEDLLRIVGAQRGLKSKIGKALAERDGREMNHTHYATHCTRTIKALRFADLKFICKLADIDEIELVFDSSDRKK